MWCRSPVGAPGASHGPGRHSYHCDVTCDVVHHDRARAHPRARTDSKGVASAVDDGSSGPDQDSVFDDDAILCAYGRVASEGDPMQQPDASPDDGVRVHDDPKTVMIEANVRSDPRLWRQNGAEQHEDQPFDRFCETMTTGGVQLNGQQPQRHRSEARRTVVVLTDSAGHFEAPVLVPRPSQSRAYSVINCAWCT